jgi:thiamine biosynthesis lipoprotein
MAAFLSDDQSAKLSKDLTLLRFSRRAMATRFEVALPSGTPDAHAAADAALDEIDHCERWMTVYDDDSEVSQLNRLGAGGSVQVSEPLFELLSLSSSLARETGGAFDPAIGAMIKAWGFFHREGRLPSAEERSASMTVSGMRHVVIDHESRAVRFVKRGLELNFGSIGKGFALDRAASLLKQKFGIRSALLHGGGSSVRAIGTPPGDWEGWPIRVTHPTDRSKSLGIIRLIDAGLATSAATFQYFVYKGKRYGHVLDPRTGQPACGTASASLVAATAAEADALSTALFVIGREAAKQLLTLWPDYGALLLSEGDRSELRRMGLLEWQPDPESPLTGCA